MVLTATSLAITSVVLFVIFTITEHLRHRRIYKQALQFKGPMVLPFIGNAHLFAGGSEMLMKKSIELMKKYSSPFRVWFGQSLYVVLTTPEQMKTVFLSSKTVDRGDVIDFVRPWWGTGLLTAPAARWKVHRKIIQPTFHRLVLEDFVQIFAEQSKIMADEMERTLDGPEFAITDFLKPCTLDIICETAMGVKVGAQTDKNCYYLTVVRKMLHVVCRRMVSPWLYPDFIFNNMKIGEEQRECIKYLHTFTKNVIETKKHELLERDCQVDTACSGYDQPDSMRQREAFLGHLLKLSEDGIPKFSDEDLREEVDTMLIAGCDSTAFTNTFTMLMLASYPDVQEQVYQELYEIYGNAEITEREVTHEDLSRMIYLERVIKETMRLFPFAPLVIRKVQDNVIIDGGHILPKGSTAVLGIIDVHRSEKYWPDPMKFDPDRFLPEEVAKRHPYTYMPFSAGPRNCIGSTYAMMAMKTLLATILRIYILKKDNVIPVEDVRLSLEIALKTAVPVKLRIERRIRH